MSEPFLLFALGWYQCFFWGTVILQESTRPQWRFPRDAFALLIAPLLPFVAAVKRIRVIRGPVVRGLLALAAVVSFAWIAMWIALAHDFGFELFLVEHLSESQQAFIASLEPSAFWTALVDPWLRMTAGAVVAIDVLLVLPMVTAMAELIVRLNAYYEAKTGEPLVLRWRLPVRTAKRPPLYLVTVRRGPESTD